MAKVKYERIEDIGSGSYGRVSKVKRSWDQKVRNTQVSVFCELLNIDYALATRLQIYLVPQRLRGPAGSN